MSISIGSKVHLKVNDLKWFDDHHLEFATVEDGYSSGELRLGKIGNYLIIWSEECNNAKISLDCSLKELNAKLEDYLGYADGLEYYCFHNQNLDDWYKEFFEEDYDDAMETIADYYDEL